MQLPYPTVIVTKDKMYFMKGFMKPYMKSLIMKTLDRQIYMYVCIYLFLCGYCVVVDVEVVVFVVMTTSRRGKLVVVVVVILFQ